MTTSQLAIDGHTADRAPGAIAGAVVVGAVAIGGALMGARDHPDALGNAGAIVVAAWALLTVFLAVRRPGEFLWLFTGVGSLIGAAALVNEALAGLVPLGAAAVVIAL